VSALLLAGFQIPFVINLALMLRRRRDETPNPWQATTLEWAPALEPGAAASRVAYRMPCIYGLHDDSFAPQWLPEPAPEQQIPPPAS
jgi:cytochrome c oxidase subunit I